MPPVNQASDPPTVLPCARTVTDKTVSAASAAWNKAPAHVRAMAGAYVSPLLGALIAINHELGALKNGR